MLADRKKCSRCLRQGGGHWQWCSALWDGSAVPPPQSVAGRPGRWRVWITFQDGETIDGGLYATEEEAQAEVVRCHQAGPALNGMYQIVEERDDD